VVAWIILVLLVIGLWVGIKSASHPHGPGEFDVYA
jgi:hypothetical protein